MNRKAELKSLTQLFVVVYSLFGKLQAFISYLISRIFLPLIINNNLLYFVLLITKEVQLGLDLFIVKLQQLVQEGCVHLIFESTHTEIYWVVSFYSNLLHNIHFVLFWVSEVHSPVALFCSFESRIK